jgi:Sortase domain
VAADRPGRARKALAALALILALGSCAAPSARPAGPGVIAPAPEPASAAADPAAPDGIPPAPAGRMADPARPRAGIDVPATPPEAPGFEVAEAPRQLTATGPVSPPVRLAIPAIGVATPLVRLGRERDGSMQVPADFARAGWFAEGPSPGQVGPAVIAGHVDSGTGPAVFFRLRELRPGDTVRVELADGAGLRFVVEQARRFPKASFPTAEVFGPAPWAALRLVTCGGDFDRARGSYRDNLVVFARLALVTR